MSVAWGLARDDAIKALTINAAEILGVADRVGSIEPGKIANLFIVEGRSARDPDEITHVVIAGRTSASTTSTRACTKVHQRGSSREGSE